MKTMGESDINRKLLKRGDLEKHFQKSDSTLLIESVKAHHKKP